MAHLGPVAPGSSQGHLNQDDHPWIGRRKALNLLQYPLKREENSLVLFEWHFFSFKSSLDHSYLVEC